MRLGIYAGALDGPQTVNHVNRVRIVVDGITYDVRASAACPGSLEIRLENPAGSPYMAVEPEASNKITVRPR